MASLGAAFLLRDKSGATTYARQPIISRGNVLNSNQNQIWCVDIGECLVFGSTAGSRYNDPPVILYYQVYITWHYVLRAKMILAASSHNFPGTCSAAVTALHAKVHAKVQLCLLSRTWFSI